MTGDLITVLTCPQLRTTYLKATLEAFDAEGANDPGVSKLLCCDGLPHKLDTVLPLGLRVDWPLIVKPDGPSGTKRAMHWIFTMALNVGAKRILYCEDDLALSKEAIRLALSYEVPDDVAFINFADRREMVNLNETVAPGLHRAPVHGSADRGLWGSHMLLINAPVLEFYVSRQVTEWSDPWPDRINSGDCLLTWALSRYSPWTVALNHWPPIANHIGDVSSLGYKPSRRCFGFVPRSADAPKPIALCRTCLAEWPCPTEQEPGHEAFT